jgi:Fic family protein
MPPSFSHFDLRLVEPAFDDDLIDLILNLNDLRTRRLSGTTNPLIFFQLKHIFHTLESIGSARIEGNRTTIAEYIETKLEGKSSEHPDIHEIQNMERAMEFIDQNVRDQKIDRLFVSELHKITVDGLKPPPNGEGDATPGFYRTGMVKIARSNHLPPEPIRVQEYMNELFDFINRNDRPKRDLLKTAIAHHRFVWVHPFTNGNGRTVRLFTYAMLVKQGFHVDQGRILNPTAVFCIDRNVYYDFLSEADKGTDDGVLTWCRYVLQGLKTEIEKIDRLLTYDFLKSKILLPALAISFERKLVTEIELEILKRAVEKQVIMASDIKDLFPGKHAVEISRNIKRLVNNKMLGPVKDNARRYVLRFDNNSRVRPRGVLALEGRIYLIDVQAINRLKLTE